VEENIFHPPLFSTVNVIYVKVEEGGDKVGLIGSKEGWWNDLKTLAAPRQSVTNMLPPARHRCIQPGAVVHLLHLPTVPRTGRQCHRWSNSAHSWLDLTAHPQSLWQAEFNPRGISRSEYLWKHCICFAQAKTTNTCFISYFFYSLKRQWMITSYQTNMILYYLLINCFITPISQPLFLTLEVQVQDVI